MPKKKKESHLLLSNVDIPDHVADMEEEQITQELNNFLANAHLRNTPFLDWIAQGILNELKNG